MSTLGVVIVIVLAVGLAFWFFNRKPESIVESNNKSEGASEPSIAPTMEVATPVVEPATPVAVEEKVVKTKRVSKPKVAAKKTVTKATPAAKTVKKPKLKAAK